MCGKGVIGGDQRMKVIGAVIEGRSSESLLKRGKFYCGATFLSASHARTTQSEAKLHKDAVV